MVRDVPKEKVQAPRLLMSSVCLRKISTSLGMNLDDEKETVRLISQRREYCFVELVCASLCQS